MKIVHCKCKCTVCTPGNDLSTVGSTWLYLARLHCYTSTWLYLVADEGETFHRNFSSADIIVHFIVYIIYGLSPLFWFVDLKSGHQLSCSSVPSVNVSLYLLVSPTSSKSLSLIPVLFSTLTVQESVLVTQF